MEKNTETKRYTIVNAAITGLVCAVVGLFVGYLIDAGTIKHDFATLFPYAAVGVTITLLNFKPLSKMAIFLLPPVYALSGFGIAAGPLLMYQLGWEREDVSEFLALIVENVPFFIFATILYNWYSSLAREKSFMVYAIFATVTVVVSLLIFKDGNTKWIMEGCYLGIGAFLFSLLHRKRPLG